MEVAVKPTSREGGTETEGYGLSGFGQSVAGVHIREETMTALHGDAWTQFIESAASFCGEVSSLDRENPIRDEVTIRAWREQADRLKASADALYALATEGQQSPTG